jgi:hypothetical protein
MSQWKKESAISLTTMSQLNFEEEQSSHAFRGKSWWHFPMQHMSKE